MRWIVYFGCIFAADLLSLANEPAYGLATREPVGPFWNAKLPERLPDRGEFSVVNAFPNLTFEDPIGIMREPHSNRLWVYGRQGLVYSFNNSSGATQTTTVLD